LAKRRFQYNTYDTDRKWQYVNEENKLLLKEFMEYASATDKSGATRETYLHNLKLFFLWVMEERNNVFFPDLKKRDFMAWLSYLIDKQKLSPSRVRQMRSTVSSLSNFCEDILSDEDERFKDYRNLIRKIPAPKLEQVREKTFLTDEQVNKLLDWLEAQKAWKHCLYVALSFTTGARKAEIMQFKRSDFTEETLKNGIYVTSVKRAKGAGMQGKRRRFYAPADAIDRYLKLYLETRTDDLDDLFISNYGGKVKPVSTNTFNQWCEKYSEYLGIPVYPHCYRASIATSLKERGKDPNKIKQLLGHEDLATTQLYIRQNEEEDIIDLFKEDEEEYEV